MNAATLRLDYYSRRVGGRLGGKYEDVASELWRWIRVRRFFATHTVQRMLALVVGGNAAEEGCVKLGGRRRNSSKNKWPPC